MHMKDDSVEVIDLVKNDKGEHSLLRADSRYIERGVFRALLLKFRRLFKWNASLAAAADDYADLLEASVRVGQAQIELNKVAFDLSKIDDINLEREELRKAEHKARLDKLSKT